MRYVFLAYLFAAVLVLSIFGFRGHIFKEPPAEVFNDMDRQARVNYQSGSEFFADGVGSRYPVPNTVPVGFEVPEESVASGAGPDRFGFSYQGDLSYYNSGLVGDFWGNGMPEEVREADGSVSEAFLKRGQERYNIYCAICHGEAGNGKGAIAYYGNGGLSVGEGEDKVKYGYSTLSNIADFHTASYTDPADPSYRNDGDIYNTITYGKGLMNPYGSSITVRDRWAIVAYIRALQSSVAAAKSAETK